MEDCCKDGALWVMSCPAVRVTGKQSWLALSEGFDEGAAGDVVSEVDGPLGLGLSHHPPPGLPPASQTAA